MPIIWTRNRNKIPDSAVCLTFRFSACILSLQKHFAYAHNIRYVMLCYVMLLLCVLTTHVTYCATANVLN